MILTDTMFKRKIYDDLLQWKKDTSGTKAVLLEGAERVGKTSVAKQFGRCEYKSYIYVNFSEASDSIKNVKECLECYLEDLDTFFMLLSVTYKRPLYIRESLIIFDDVDCFPRARESIKRLVNDGRYDYMEIGAPTALGEETENIVIPSEERAMKMYPMDFEEFCWALGKSETIEYIRDCYNRRISLNAELHKKAMLLFEQYMVVGGMPQAVSTFVDGKKNLLSADAEKRSILTQYRNSMAKNPSAGRLNVLNVYNSLPSIISKTQTEKICGNTDDSGSDCRRFDALSWLSETMMCNISFNCINPSLNLSLTEDTNNIKCYMGDTGLLFSDMFGGEMPYEDGLYQKIFSDNISVNGGVLYENVISQMLVSSGHRLYFYSGSCRAKGKNNLQIDFLVTDHRNYKICPIEVKSVTHYTTESLESFKDKYRNRISVCVVISPENFYAKNDILHIPPYMTFCL